MFRTLISPETLHENLRAPAWRVIDCRFDLADTAAGERAWREAHIPGALHAHLDRDLSGPVTPQTGRHPLPDPDVLAQTFGRWGIAADTQVVAYDAGNGAFAARLWWLLRWLGHEAVAVLDGGWAAWRALDFPADSVAANIAPTKFPRRAALAAPLNADEVLRAVEGAAGWRLVDARAPERFRGDNEPIDPVAGRIPGAVNRPIAENLAGGRFLAPEILRAGFDAIAGGDAQHVVHYCGSGVAACQNLLAMEHAGLSGSRLYAGSWSEWIRDPMRPAAKGD